MDVENRLVVAKGDEQWGRERLGVCYSQMKSVINKMDKQGPIV